MAYDERLAGRVRKQLSRRKGLAERKMFGGLAFLLDGHMCCGVVDCDLCLRLGDDGTVQALKRAHVRPMDFTGKPLKSMVYVAAAGLRTEKQLAGWVRQAVEFTRTLPPK
jgi:TfoX/Sxy family transcriptional regulator of competence genes